MAARRFIRRRTGFRRRSGPKGTWFPMLGNSWSNEGGSLVWWDQSFSGYSGKVQLQRAQGPQQNCFPLTKDITQFSNTSVDISGPGLRDIVEGNTWRVDRIVGKFHAFCSSSTTSTPDPNDVWNNIQVAAGLFVARTGDNDQSLPDLTFDEIDPQNVINAQNPWLWRRTWILQAPLSTNIGYSAVPCSTMQYGDIQSGPHIDSKVKRIITREHRLFFVVGTIGWNGTQTQVLGDEADQPSLRFNLDLRIFGRMKRGRNVGTF